MAKVKSYDLIRKPLITEKSTLQTELSKYIFEVHEDATKTSVKEAIQQLFSVNVVSVNIKNRKGKMKRTRRSIGKRADVKIAIVTLKDGQTIDLSAGV